VVVVNAGNNYGYSAAVEVARKSTFRVVAAVHEERQAEILRSRGLERLDPLLDASDPKHTKFHHMALQDLNSRVQAYSAAEIPLVGVIVVVGPEQLSLKESETHQPHPAVAEEEFKGMTGEGGSETQKAAAHKKAMMTSPATIPNIYFVELADTLLALQSLGGLLMTPYTRIVVVLQSNSWSKRNATASAEDINGGLSVEEEKMIHRYAV
jgi:hypothetical protein